MHVGRERHPLVEFEAVANADADRHSNECHTAAERDTRSRRKQQVERLFARTPHQLATNRSTREQQQCFTALAIGEAKIELQMLPDTPSLAPLKDNRRSGTASERRGIVAR